MDDFWDNADPLADDFQRKSDDYAKNSGDEMQPDGEKNDDALADLAELKKEKRKKASNRQPLLNEDRLISSRGIPELAEMLADVKFRGKGREIEDLNTLMAQMEFWAHRLCPKMPFDDVLLKAEDLGTKRAVKTFMTRLREGDTVKVDVASIEDDHPATEEMFHADDSMSGAQDEPITDFGEPRKIELTEEQRQKIEDNKRRAQELRTRKVIASTQQIDDDLDDILGSLPCDFEFTNQPTQCGNSQGNEVGRSKDDTDFEDY